MWTHEARGLLAQMQCLNASSGRGARQTSGAVAALYEFDPWALGVGADGAVGAVGAATGATATAGSAACAHVLSTDAGDEVIETVRNGWKWAVARPAEARPGQHPRARAELPGARALEADCRRFRQ